MLLNLGSTGADVVRLEARLTELGLYAGPADGIFGGGVESAVKAFQRSQGLNPDGVVGDITWGAILPGVDPSVNPILNAPLTQRCLALTGAFETSTGIPDCYAGIAGDFDGQGISFGVLQWNFGQRTLQPMLLEMIAAHEDTMSNLFHDRLAELRNMLTLPFDGQLAWTRSIQDPVRHVIFQPWQGLFKALGRTPEFQAIQVEHAGKIHQNALQLCARFGVNTERAGALMFDISVQNGSISSATEAIIRQDFAAFSSDLSPMDLEVAKMRSIANRRAEAANPKFIEDVRVRKLTIANGQGTVHGVTRNLERDFGIRLQPVATA